MAKFNISLEDVRNYRNKLSSLTDEQNNLTSNIVNNSNRFYNACKIVQSSYFSSISEKINSLKENGNKIYENNSQIINYLDRIIEAAEKSNKDSLTVLDNGEIESISSSIE